ncbi:MAG: hypothetical protein ACM3WQ_00165 [Chloroflexota bacterium]
MTIKEIVEVFYAPHKAFKRIVQNPKFLAAIIVLIIYVAVQVGSSYVVSSRSYLEQTQPTGTQSDVWTENPTLWQASPGVAITANHVDYINSSVLYYNNTSIEFITNNASTIQIFLSDFGQSVNCDPDGFKNISIRVKIISPTSIPDNVTLYLFSLSPANYFAYDLTASFSNTTIAQGQFWNNITVPLNTDGWISSNSATTWTNITGLRMDFGWPGSSSINLRVDGLFFRGIYKGLLEINTTSVLTNAALSAATPFLFQWLLLTGLMYLLIKGLKGNVVWKPLMAAVGVALVTLVVHAVILTIIYAELLPNIYYPLEIVAAILGEADAATLALQNGLSQIFQISSYVQIAIWIWLFGLGTFIVRTITGMVYTPRVDILKPETSAQPETEASAVSLPQFGWVKSALVSAVSLALTIIILGFLGIS